LSLVQHLGASRVIMTSGFGITTLPSVSFGSSTSTKADILPLTQLTGLANPYDRWRSTNVALKGINELWYDVDAAGAGSSLFVRFYFKGFAAYDDLWS